MIWLLSAVRISEKNVNMFIFHGAMHPSVYRNAAEPTKPKFDIQIQIRQNIHESRDGK